MNNQTIPAPVTTQKSRRNAAATHANDRTILQCTEFGRRRVPSYPVRFMLGFLGLLGSPLVAVCSAVRVSKRPLEQNSGGSLRKNLND